MTQAKSRRYFLKIFPKGLTGGRAFETPLTIIKEMKKQELHAAQLETPLGMMLAIASKKELLFLDFIDRLALTHLNRKLSASSFKSHLGLWKEGEERWERFSTSAFFQEGSCSSTKLERKVKQLSREKKAAIFPGENEILQSVEGELAAYFEGTLHSFETPFSISGSVFQKAAWEALLQVSYGLTKSYAEQATMIGNPMAVRAVANANGANRLAIIIPCHRIIGSHGGLGGYGSGLERKKWLLEHERNHSTE